MSYKAFPSVRDLSCRAPDDSSFPPHSHRSTSPTLSAAVLGPDCLRSTHAIRPLEDSLPQRTPSCSSGIPASSPCSVAPSRTRSRLGSWSGSAASARLGSRRTSAGPRDSSPGTPTPASTSACRVGWWAGGCLAQFDRVDRS